jgi:putative ABC transport system substrate-binding protein
MSTFRPVMSRRHVFAAAAGALVAAGRIASAQPQAGSARIGWLTTGDTVPRHYFDEAMARLGWVEGRNLVVERRVSGPDPARRAALVAELVALRPALIVAGGPTDAVPLRAATSTIPIVVIHGTDLVESGLVESLSRPGGNVTGNTVLGRELDGKRIELLRELIPTATRASMLGTSRADYPPRLEAAQAMARPLGIEITPRIADQPADLDAAFAAAAAAGDQAVLVPFDALTFENRPRLIAAAARSRLPAIYDFREYVEVGGLISYGAVYRDYFARAAALADMILKGASPAELPVEQPTRFELVANLRTARELALPVPPALLARADEVIE